MTWLDHPEERKRILMDLDVMAEHKSPHIVLYYGSVIWNVSTFNVIITLQPISIFLAFLALK